MPGRRTKKLVLKAPKKNYPRLWGKQPLAAGLAALSESESSPSPALSSSEGEAAWTEGEPEPELEPEPGR